MKYASIGTSEDDSLDEDVFNISPIATPHIVIENKVSATSAVDKKTTSIHGKEENMQKQIGSIASKSSIQETPKSVGAPSNQGQKTTVEPSESNAKKHSIVSPPQNAVKVKEPVTVPETNKASTDGGKEKIAKMQIAAKEEEKCKKEDASATKPKLAEKTTDANKDKVKAKKNVIAQKTDKKGVPNNQNITEKSSDKNVKSKVDESASKKDNKAVSDNKTKETKTILSPPADHALNVTEKSMSARAPEGDSQSKRFRTESSSSYGSLFGGSSSIEHDASTIAAQMEKIPSPVRKMLESKSKVSFSKHF